MIAIATVFMLALLSLAPSQREPEPVRKEGMCFVTVTVTGPEAARAFVIQQAKAAYTQPDASILQGLADQVVIQVTTDRERVQYRACALSSAPIKEIVFVDTRTDRPVLRRPVQSREVAVTNGFGATWSTHDAFIAMPLSELRTTLGDGDYSVVIVYNTGNSLKLEGIRGTPFWGAADTKRVR